MWTVSSFKENVYINTKEGYTIKIFPVVTDLIIIINTNVSKIYESKLNYEYLKKNKIFNDAKNIYEIIKELINYINNLEYKFINKDNNFILEINPRNIEHEILKITFEEKKDKIELIQNLMTDLEIFFSCIYCRKIVLHPYSCTCPKFICENCFLNNKKNNFCPFCKKQFEKETNTEIDYLVSEIFKDQKVLKEKINVYILLSEKLKSLYLNQKLKLIIKHTPNYEDLTPKETMNLINNISNEEFFENIKDFEMNFTPMNILDYISTIGDLIDNYIKKKNIILLILIKHYQVKKELPYLLVEF